MSERKQRYTTNFVKKKPNISLKRQIVVHRIRETLVIFYTVRWRFSRRFLIFRSDLQTYMSVLPEFRHNNYLIETNFDAIIITYNFSKQVNMISVSLTDNFFNKLEIQNSVESRNLQSLHDSWHLTRKIWRLFW